MYVHVFIAQKGRIKCTEAQKEAHWPQFYF